MSKVDKFKLVIEKLSTEELVEIRAWLWDHDMSVMTPLVDLTTSLRRR